MLVAVHGKVLFQYGDVTRVSEIASVRKSVLSMLYGNYVASGKIDLPKTVKEIGLQDVKPFLPIEERAKLEQLIAGRSGIYIVPEKLDPHSADSFQPPRGSELPAWRRDRPVNTLRCCPNWIWSSHTGWIWNPTPGK